MKAILFIARVAFIFNLMFVLYLLGYLEIIKTTNTSYMGFVIATGYGLPIIVNAIFFTALVIRLFRGKGTKGIPPWLITANFLLYLAEILMFFLS